MKLSRTPESSASDTFTHRYVRQLRFGERRLVSALQVHRSGLVSAIVLEKTLEGFEVQHQSVHSTLQIAREHLNRALLAATVSEKVLAEYRETSELN